MTAGFSAASFSLDRQRRAVLGLRLRGRPVSSAGSRGCCGCRQAAAEFGDGGVVLGQLLLDRQRSRNSASASAGRPVSASRMTDAEDRVRQVAAGVVRGPGGRGQRLLVGPRLPVGRQRRRRSGRSWTGASPAAIRQAASAARAAGSEPAGPGQQRLRPRGRPPAPRRSSPSLRAGGDGGQAPADVGRRRGAGPGSAASASRAASTARCAASASSLRPTLPVRSASSKFDAASARRDGRRPSPCPAGPRACRRSRLPTSAAGRAAPGTGPA